MNSGIPSDKMKKAKRNNAFRRKPAGAVVETFRLPLDLEPKTPKIREEEALNARRTGFKAAVAVVVVLLLAALGYAAVKESVWSNPAFSLRHIYVRTSGMLTPTELAVATGLTEGVNLLTTDLGAVRARLMSLPAVRGASVQRDFSGRLDVTVQQRQPIAWVHCEHLGWVPLKSGSGLLVDEEGVAIPCVNMSQSFASLPVIQDETINQILGGIKIPGEQFAAALRLIKELRQREAMGGDGLLTVKVKNTCVLQASLRSGLSVSFAWDDLDEELARYDKVTGEAAKRKWHLVAANLMAEHNLPVIFKASAAPGAAPAAIPLSRPASLVRHRNGR